MANEPPSFLLPDQLRGYQRILGSSTLFASVMLAITPCIVLELTYLGLSSPASLEV